MKRIVIYSETDGVYLGSAMGMGFWSKLDPVGQSEACTFPSVAEAKEYVQSWGCEAPEDIDYREVEVLGDKQGFYATISEIVAAGMDGWFPNQGFPEQRGQSIH